MSNRGYVQDVKVFTTDLRNHHHELIKDVYATIKFESTESVHELMDMIGCRYDVVKVNEED